MTSFFQPGSNDPTIIECGHSRFQVYCNSVLPVEKLLQTWYQEANLAVGVAAVGVPILLWILHSLRQTWGARITTGWRLPRRREPISRGHDKSANAAPISFESTKSFRIYSATESQSELGDARQYDLSIFPLTATGRSSSQSQYQGGFMSDSNLMGSLSRTRGNSTRASSITAATIPNKMSMASVDLGTLGSAALEENALDHTANFLADSCLENSLAGLAVRSSTTIEPRQVERLLELLCRKDVSVLLICHHDSDELDAIRFEHASGLVIENATMLRNGERRDYFGAKRLRDLMGRCGQERERRPDFFVGFLELWHKRPHPSIIRRAVKLADHFGAVVEHGPVNPKLRIETCSDDATRTLSGFEYLRRGDLTELQKCWTSDVRKVWVPNSEPVPENVRSLPLQDLDLAIPYASHFLNQQSLPLELGVVRDEHPALTAAPEYASIAPRRRDFWEIAANGVAFSHLGCFSLVAEPSAEDYVAVVATQSHLKELQMLRACTAPETHRMLEELRPLTSERNECGHLIQDLVRGLESQQVVVYKGLDTGFRVPDGDGYFWGVAKAREGDPSALSVDIFISQAAPHDAATVLHTWLAHRGIRRSVRFDAETKLEKANGQNDESGLPLSVRVALERATDAERLQMLQQMRVSQLHHRLRGPITMFCRSMLIDQTSKQNWNQCHARGILDGSMSAETMFRTRLAFFARCGATELPCVDNLVTLYELVERTIHDALFYGDREPINAFTNALVKAFRPGASSDSGGFVDVNADLFALTFFSILRKVSFEEVYIESTDRCPIFLACPDQAAVFSELWVLGSQCEIFLGLLPSDLGEIIYNRYKDFLEERSPLASDRENNEIMTMYSSGEGPPPSNNDAGKEKETPQVQTTHEILVKWRKRFTEFGAMSIFCLPAIIDVLLLTFVGRGMFMTAYMDPSHLQAAGYALLIALLMTAGITGWVGSTGAYYLAHYAYDNMTTFHVQRLSGGFVLTIVVAIGGFVTFTVQTSAAVGFVFVAFLIVITTYLNLLGVMATMHQHGSPMTSGRTVLWRTIPVLLLSPIISTFVNSHDLEIYLPITYSTILLLLYQYRRLCHEWAGWMKMIPEVSEKEINMWYTSSRELEENDGDAEKTDGDSKVAQAALRMAVSSYSQRSRDAVSSGLLKDEFVSRIADGMPYIDWLFKKTNPDGNMPEVFSSAWFTQLGEAKKQQQQLSRGLKEHNIMLLFRNARYDMGQNLGLFLVALMDRWVSIAMSAREPHRSIYTDSRARYGICFCILYFCFAVMMLDVILQDYWTLRFVISKEKLIDYRHARAVARDWESMRRRTLVSALARLLGHITFIFGITTILLWAFVESAETTILYYLYILGYTSVIVFQFNRCFTTNIPVHVTIIFASAVVGFLAGCALHAIPATAGWLYSDVVAQNIAAVSAALGTLMWSWKDWTAPGAESAPLFAVAPKRDIWLQRNLRAASDAESKVMVGKAQKVVGPVTKFEDQSVMSQKITQLLHRSLKTQNRMVKTTPWSTGIIRTAIRRWEQGRIKITVVSQEKFTKAGLRDICSFSQVDGEVVKVVAGFLREAELRLPSWKSQLATMLAESLLYHVARVDGMLSHSQAVQAEHFIHRSAIMSKRIELELATADFSNLSRFVRKSNAEIMRHLCLDVDVDSGWETLPLGAREAIFARITGHNVALSEDLCRWLSDRELDMQMLDFHLQLTLAIYCKSDERYKTAVYLSRNSNPTALATVPELRPVRLTTGRLGFSRLFLRCVETVPLAFVKWVAVISGGGADIERELSYSLRNFYFRRLILYFTLSVWKACWLMKNFWVSLLLVYHRPALVNITRLARKGARRVIKKNCITAELRDKTITGFAIEGGDEDGGMVLEAFEGALLQQPSQEKKPIFKATYDMNLRLTSRLDSDGNTSTYQYTPGSRSRWPVSKEIVDSTCRTISFYDKYGRTLHGVTSPGSAAYAFHYHYKTAPKGSPDLLRADFKPLSAASSDRLSVFWGMPSGGDGSKAEAYDWSPSEKIRRIVRVVDGKKFVTEIEYHHRRDPVVTTILEGADDGQKTAISHPPRVFPEEETLLKRPGNLMFELDDILIHHGLLQVKRMRHAAKSRRSVIPHWTALPMWGSRVYRPVPTWHIRTALWRGWLGCELDAVSACWLDELILREEPLLRTYWRARDIGDVEAARQALNGGIDQIVSAIDLETEVSELCLLPIRTADLYAMGLGKDATQVTNRPQDCYRDTGDRISVIVNDIGCWPEAPGGVSNCRRDLVNGHSTIRNHVLAECANEYGIPRFQVERNVQSLKLLPLWGLDGKDAHHGLIDNILQSQVDEKMHDTETQRDIAGVFVPLLKDYVKGARTKRYSRADLVKYTNVMLSIAKYYEHKDYNRTWNSKEVEDAWAEAWLMPYNDANINDPGDYFDIQRPSFYDFREAMGIYMAYFFIFSVQVPDECPRVFQSTHHGISSLFGMILKYRRGVTFGIWDHAILWRESCLNISPAQCELPISVQMMLLSGIRMATRLAYFHADVVTPCTSLFNPMWETELGSDRGQLCNRNHFRRKIEPIVNGISNMDSFTPVDRVRTDKPTVVMLSNIQFIKGIKTAILAADVIVNRYGFRDYKLMVYGAKDRQPSYALEMDKLIVKCGLSDNVILAGFGKPKEVLKDAWLFMNSSVSEGLPLAIGEAALAGVPIVATEVGATALVMTDPEDQEQRYGEVVAPNDPVALARAQLNILCMVGPWTKFTTESKSATPLSLPDDITPDDVEWLSRRMHERSKDRRKLGLRSREVVLHSFHGNRYLREHEQMYWIQWHMSKMRADIALMTSSNNDFKFSSPPPLRYTEEAPNEEDIDDVSEAAEAARYAEEETLLRSAVLLPGAQHDLESQLGEKEGRFSRLSKMLREPKRIDIDIDSASFIESGRSSRFSNWQG
ncbi:hypothetical protein RJ55_02029 [Drechmeria coniospora]|nr:hypothetical protein RJ55_02029 [Drechmeria coniospora]